MSKPIDLTPFGFTPTESVIYQVLLAEGPGTGYTIARAAGLARANVYAALESLVSKGGALIEAGQPRRFRPEPPANLLARLSDQQGRALDSLESALSALEAPATPTLVELTSPRGALQLMAHEIARAEQEIILVAPIDALFALQPQLRQASANRVPLQISSTGSGTVGPLLVERITAPDWPGDPVLLLTGTRGALIGARKGNHFSGHWSSGPVFIATARRLSTGFERL